MLMMDCYNAYFGNGKIDMLTVNKYRDILLKEFYLDSDDMTIRRATDGYRGRWQKHDSVSGYKLCKHGYEGIHIPRTRTTVNYSHLITILRGINIPDNSIIDHIDGNTKNNSRSNIRITSQQLNCRNAKARPNKSTGVSGITKDKNGKFIVRLYIDGTRQYLGYRSSLEDAILLRESISAKRTKDGYTIRHGK